MVNILVRGFATLAVGMFAGDAIPVLAQTPASPAPVVSVLPPMCPKGNATLTFYAPNQTCSFTVKLRVLATVTIVGGNDDMTNVSPQSGISQTPGNQGTVFTVTSGPKGGQSTFVSHYEYEFGTSNQRGLGKTGGDRKTTATNKY
jgi:hypothetical protein